MGANLPSTYGGMRTSDAYWLRTVTDFAHSECVKAARETMCETRQSGLDAGHSWGLFLQPRIAAILPSGLTPILPSGLALISPFAHRAYPQSTRPP